MNRPQHRSRPDLHSDTLLTDLLMLDVLHLSALLAVMVTDDIKYKEIVDQRGSSAQILLNLLQAVRDSLLAAEIPLESLKSQFATAPGFTFHFSTQAPACQGANRIVTCLGALPRVLGSGRN